LQSTARKKQKLNNHAYLKKYWEMLYFLLGKTHHLEELGFHVNLMGKGLAQK